MWQGLSGTIVRILLVVEVLIGVYESMEDIGFAEGSEHDVAGYQK